MSDLATAVEVELSTSIYSLIGHPAYTARGNWSTDVTSTLHPTDYSLIPPGFPLGYLVETHICTCGGCGNEQRTTAVMVRERFGGINSTTQKQNTRLRPAGANEVMYDVNIDFAITRRGTPRCDRCIGKLPLAHISRLHPRNYNLSAGISRNLGPTMEKHLGLDQPKSGKPAKLPAAPLSLDELDV